MDARIEPLSVFELGLGDAHVLRNAGGLITDDLLRSLAISQRALGTTDVAVMHHTKCGMQGFDDISFRLTLTEETGQVPRWDVPGFDDVTEQVHRSVEAVRSCPWLPHRDAVRGYVFDVEQQAVQATI